MNRLVKNIFSSKACQRMIFLWLIIIDLSLYAQRTDPKIVLADSIYYSDPEKSCELCVEAEKRAKQNADLDLIADARLCKARYHLLKADYRRAEKNITQAIERFKQIGSKNRLASAFNLYAIYYDRLNEPQKSYDYQNESIRLFRETKNTQGMANIMNNLANAYIDDDRFSQAKELLDEVEGYKERLSQGALYFYYQNRGYLQLKSNELQKALISLNEGLRITKDQKMMDSEITILTLIGRTYIKLKNYAQAQINLNTAEQLAFNRSLIYELGEVYDCQEELYTLQKNTKGFDELKIKRDSLLVKTQYLERLNNDKKKNHRKGSRGSNQKVNNGIQKNQNAADKSNGNTWMYAISIGILFLIGIVIYISRKRNS